LENAEEYNDNLHEEVHRLNNQLNPLLPRNNNADEELEPVSDEDGGEILDTDSEDDT
jgi:hypothetical protein